MNRIVLAFALLIPATALAQEIPIDFSSAGYGAGAPLPAVAAVARVEPSGGDDTALLQASIDHVGRRRPDRAGFRGAVLLGAGEFHVSGQLRLDVSGVVLRGMGRQTRIIATGQNRRALIRLGVARPARTSESARIAADAPAGATELAVDDVTAFAAGDRVIVSRPSTTEWIHALGMDQYQGNFANQRTNWLPGSRDLSWTRVLVAVDKARRMIRLDAPITTALELRFGGATIARADELPPTKRVGIENLTLESAFNASNPKDEEHAWIAAHFDNVEDAWARSVTARHFAGSAIRVGPGARRVTAVVCHSEAPVSEIGGYRRQSFLVEGTQVLVDGCTAESGLNDFALGLCASGPNVFRDCRSERALGPSGSFESWASGALYERVRIKGAALRLARDDERSQGGGWTAANCVARDCEATEIVLEGPPGAPVVLQAGKTAPTAEFRPAPVERPSSVPLFKSAKPSRRAIPPPSAGGLSIVHGRFVVDGRALWGGQLNAAWWKGQTPAAIATSVSGRSITRFVPGRQGPGLTEDLEELADDMLRAGTASYTATPGLWYDRRRDDHLVVERTTADVWAPFYEMPWARSGQGIAWDGLSKYDLTRYNPWYFERIRAFSAICRERGLVFYNNLYNTHNLLETLAHWVDYPWRPANNINETGLPEPPPLDEGRAVHLAFQVYDVSHPAIQALHRDYIRRQLDNMADSPNVIHSVAFQFAGPLSFQQFFLDTVAEWERETGRDAKVALITSKDITDAILADEARARLVDVVDMRYWQRLADGAMWAPPGDRNRAFREINTEIFGKGVDTPPDSTPLFVYQQVREYRDRFPEKAIVAWNGGVGPVPILMAGGAQALMRNPAAGQSQGAAADPALVSAFVREYLASALANMTPRDGWLADPDGNWALADRTADNALVYSVAGPTITLEVDLPGEVGRAVWFDPVSGKTQHADLNGKLEKGKTCQKPTEGAWLLYLKRKN